MNSVFCKLLEKCCVQNSNSKEANILATMRVLRMRICLDIQNSKSKLKSVFSKIQGKQHRSKFSTPTVKVYVRNLDLR